MPDQQLPQPAARTTPRGHSARALSTPADQRLARGVAGAQRIRAHQHHGGERLFAGGDARLSEKSGRRAAWHRHRSAAPRHHLQRWHAHGRNRRRKTGICRGIGTGRRRHWRGAARCRPARARSHRLRYGWHHRQGGDHRGRSAQHDLGIRVPRRHLDLEPVSQGRRLHVEGAGHRHRRGWCRRRLVGRHRPRRPAQGRSAIGGRRARTRLLRPRQRSSTVTDANLVLGLINPHALAGGRLRLDRSLSERAIDTEVARPLGLSLIEAAHGIRAVANASMARAIRAVTVERGRDPRDLTLVAFGGNGGMHATDLARELGISRIVVPPLAGVFSAVGMLACDLQHVALKTVTRGLDELSPNELRASKAELAEQVLARLAADGFMADRVVLDWEADLRHEGQATELTVHYAGDDPAELRRRFLAEYGKTYGYQDASPIELAKLRLLGRGLRDQRLQFEALNIAAPAAAPTEACRPVQFARGAPAQATEVLARSALSSRRRRGPLIIEEFDATVVVPADATVHLDGIGNIVLELE